MVLDTYPTDKFHFVLCEVCRRAIDGEHSVTSGRFFLPVSLPFVLECSQIRSGFYFRRVPSLRVSSDTTEHLVTILVSCICRGRTVGGSVAFNSALATRYLGSSVRIICI